MAMTRRKFLKDAGIGSLILMAWQSGLLSSEDVREIEEAIARGDESWTSSVCQQCPGACGIRVRKLGGWPVSIVGNPLHPINRGTLCPKGVSGILSFYDPDRLRSPLKRTGERGSGKWEKISWEEALNLVANELGRLREQKTPHQFAVLGGRYRGLMRGLFERFLKAYGSPNYLDNSFAAWQGPVEALARSQGISGEPKYDLANAHYLLSFSAPLLEAGTSPVENLRGWGEFRRGRSEHRGKVVQIEPRLSITGAKADEWVPIQAGNEGWLALGIAHIILREDLYDDSFLGEHSLGFSSFKSLVLENYPPQTITELTGVPIDTIIRLAREFAASRPALAVSARIDPRDQAAIHTLNALVGSIGTPGGVLVPVEPEPPALPEPQLMQSAAESERTAKQGLGKIRRIAGEPYPLQVLFFYYTNPLFSNPGTEKLRETFAKIPLLVSFSPFFDETAAFSDLILPDHNYLERRQDVPASTQTGSPLIGLAQPAHSPLHNTRHTGDFLLQLAHKLGDPIASALPWENFEAVLQEEWKAIFESQKGDLFGGEFESTWTSFLVRSGWWSPSYGSLEEFRTQLRVKGGWWNPSDSYQEWGRVFPHPSGKYEFPALKDLPTLAPRRNEALPLLLHVYPLMALTGGRNANQAWLADIAGPQLQTGWKTWCEINPETARKLGIADNDEIWVESLEGKIKVTARWYDGIHPEVVGMPFGFGHTAVGRWAKGIGENPRKIQESDPEAELPRERITRVRVYKA